MSSEKNKARGFQVVKSNKLISARYRLSVVEQRVVLSAIAQIKPGDKDLRRYRVRIADIASMMGDGWTNPYGKVKRAIQKLTTRGLTIHEPDGDLVTSWLSSGKYRDKEGAVYLRFDPDLKPYLLQLKGRFTAYGLEEALSLRSRHSFRFYELIKHREGLGAWEFTLEELRELLGLMPTEYPEWRGFRRRVLDVAKAELNKATSIRFDYETITTGRKVTGVRFIINKGTQQELELFPKTLSP